MRSLSCHPVLVGASALALSFLLSSPARAVVTQVDGAVVPQADRLQNALDQPVTLGGEGTAGLVNAVFDAAVVPEVFLIPKDSNGNYRTVEFFDIREGAGYENTFGWYNVADPTKLYPVLTCTPTNYEPPQTVNVNFQTEFTAGRYLGGYVGFFLVSPGGDGGCGDPADLGQAGSTTFIVYTESQLNGDGNYVHYLIYQSKQNPLAYYFGFEDLWRGGDNDFEDMAIKVTGLVKPCEPSQEICDGLDNNCDGLIDNDPVDVGQACVTIAGNHPGAGPCKAGTLVCASTGPGNKNKKCDGEVGPSTELCNKIDDDCDGTPDNHLNDPALGQDCGPTDEGACELGKTECVAGVPTCLNTVGPSPEFCNNVDDDCDGVVDGTAGTSATTCTTDADCDASAPLCLPSSLLGTNVCSRGPLDAVGNCVLPGSTCPGSRQCVAGAITCVPGSSGSAETCNGADDNCNGLIDEGDPGGGAECGPPGEDGNPISLDMAHTGQCSPGVVHCLGAQLRCIGGRGPSPEICDGLDNDCDGVADQAALCPGVSKCVEGKCADPCGSGEFPCPGGLVCKGGYCVKNDGTGGSGGGGGAGGGDAGPGGDASAGTGGAGGVGGGSGTAGGPSGSAASVDGNDNWGLATGGGGCALGGAPAHGAALLAGIGAIALVLRRRSHRRSSEGRGA